MNTLDRFVAEAVLGIDTLWGGDVMCPSGTGRFIADSWFSDEPLPAAYTSAAAARVRSAGGLSAKAVDRDAIDQYLRDTDLPQAIAGVREQSANLPSPRREYLAGIALCLDTMWQLAMETLGNAKSVAYEDCVIASTGHAPVQSDPTSKRARLAELLSAAGHPATQASLLEAVDAWRRERMTPMGSVRALGAAVIAQFDALSQKNLLPHLPPEMARVPRANIEFLPIQEAWFSGSMNYVGRARNRDGLPQYEATYEINAKLQLSFPEFQQLVSHEVVPGHVTTFAYLQDLYVRGQLGFEATVLTMNTRGATLFEGIANNAILIAHDVTEVEQLPDPDMQIGVLLALLQDDAKNQASYLLWQEHRERSLVARTLREQFLVSEERADKLSGAWGQHPLLGRMYLPAYRSGTERVAALRRRYPARQVLPVIYGGFGLVDACTVEDVIKEHLFASAQ